MFLDVKSQKSAKGCHRHIYQRIVYAFDYTIIYIYYNYIRLYNYIIIYMIPPGWNIWREVNVASCNWETSKIASNRAVTTWRDTRFGGSPQDWNENFWAFLVINRFFIPKLHWEKVDILKPIRRLLAQVGFMGYPGRRLPLDAEQWTERLFSFRKFRTLGKSE